MHQHTVRARGGINPEIDLNHLEQLQVRLDVANMLIALRDLPTIIERGKQLEREVRAEVLRIVQES